MARTRSAVFSILAAACFAFTQACATQPQLSSGIDSGGMDESRPPGDDFNAYSNGAWSRTTPIPPDKSSYGVGTIVADKTRQQLLDLIQGAAKSGASDPVTQKVGDFYLSYIDEAEIESKGLTPLQPELDSFASIADRAALSRALGSHLRADVDALNNTNFETMNLLGVWVTQGLTDPDHSYPYLLQGGLGMPDRDYYLSPSPHMSGLRAKYQAHIEAMFRLAGYSDPAARAARVFALETRIAQVHSTRTESEDVNSAVIWKRDELAAKAPGLDWPALLDAAGLGATGSNAPPAFIAWQPKAIAGISALVATEPLEAWKDWLVLHTLEQSANFLPAAFVNEHFKFFGSALSGTPEMQPRWQRGIDFTSAALGDAVGKLYADKFFPPETKAKVQAMVADLVQAFGRRIGALTWMSPQTKTKAQAKLATLRVGVGYPDKWEDFSGIQVIRGDALGNAQRASVFRYHRQLAKLGQPIDRSEWWMTPQTVNAVNLPLQNALNFPAAILQPPYFDAAADAAHNYGAMGAIIGHEISHSFDDEGAQFDADGRLMNWWTPVDFDHFKASGEALARQFDAYCPFPGLCVNGHQTLSENIADVAGLMTAYDAYQLSLQGKEDVEKDGFTGDQRFFLSFAQTWRRKAREAALRAQIATDGHAPAEYRADTVRNLDQWYSAFYVKPGDALYLAPSARVHVW